jgi:hypothetical protein
MWTLTRFATTIDRLPAPCFLLEKLRKATKLAPQNRAECKWQQWAAGPCALFQEGTSSLRLLQILVFGLCPVELTVPSITRQPRSFYPTLILS